jgi:hypothetical protein
MASLACFPGAGRADVVLGTHDALPMLRAPVLDSAWFDGDLERGN